MHQTRKGNQYYFSMKANGGTDAASGLVHSVKATAANVADVTQAGELLHGDEREAFGDAGYQGVTKRSEHADSDVDWHVAMKRQDRKSLGDDERGQALEACEQLKAKIRSRVEHPFQVLKSRFQHRKARYRGIAKNEAQLFTLFGLGNLVLAQRRLAHYSGGGVC